MATFQIIGYEGHDFNPGLEINSFSSPRSPGLFDVTIVNLTSSYLWKSRNSSCSVLNYYNDLKNLYEMIKNNSDKKYVFVLPQDTLIEYDYSGSRYYKNIQIKNNLNFAVNLISEPLPMLSHLIDNLIYEPSQYNSNGQKFSCDFVLKNSDSYKTLLETDVTKKPCFIRIDDNIYVTTLKFSKVDHLVDMIQNLEIVKEQSDEPEWLACSYFLDDSELNEKLNIEAQKRDEATANIRNINNKLKKNNHFKKVLYKSGDDLVEVVLEIFGTLINADFSSFIDNHNEDFSLELGDYKILGEIKGISSNVRREHVTQGLLHREKYESYCEDNEIEFCEDKIISLLVINHQRNLPVSDRVPINDLQINHAKNNHILIIETTTLLKLLDKFSRNELDVEKIKKLIIDSKDSGLLSI